MSNFKLTEAEVLERDRIALENVESQSEIAAIMAELGYDSEKITEGKGILTDTRTAFDSNKTEDDETSAAYAAFKSLSGQVADAYSIHRKKAKVVFRKDSLTLDKLGINGSIPQAYVKWLEVVKKFYSVSNADSDIQASLSRLRISIDDLNAGGTQISDLEAARAEYLREKGESQDATKAKDAAFDILDDWMSEFYAVAKIALEDNPQLLEALGKTVR
jgi:hypothetical protein